MANIEPLIKPLAEELSKRILRKQTLFKSDTFKFSKNVVDEIALLTIEFGADLHCNLGLWKAYESLNKSIFGNELPIHDELYERDLADKFDPARVQHFLWKIFNDFNPQSVLSPADEELEDYAEFFSNFLTDNFKRLTIDSERKVFFEAEMKEAGDVKQKLVWLGTQSYLFRTSFLFFTVRNKLEPNVDTVDQFICQETTRWSGYSPVQVLAEMLNLQPSLKKELLSWEERVQGFFKIVKFEKETVHGINLLNQLPYKICTPDAEKHFGGAFIIHGWIIPWDGNWYWSGQQRKYKEFTEEELNEVVTTYLQRNPRIEYQFDREKLKKASDAISSIYDDSLEYFKTDLGCFATGSEMVAQLKAKDVASLKKRNPEHTSEGPDYSFPETIMNCDNGIGFFLNKTEGIELFMGYTDLISGMQKRNGEINDSEAESIYEFITSQNISPEFVNRLVSEYGSEAILEVFFLEELEADQALTYLYRCYKGNYFQKRYPNITLTGHEQN